MTNAIPYRTGNSFQPFCGSSMENSFNKDGAKKVVIAAPALPIPKIPNALPCHSLGYQIDVKPIPTAKLVPTMPNKKLRSANIKKLSASGKRNKGIEQRRSNKENTYLPPNLSVSMPIGKRMMDPVKIGIPKSHPTCTTSHLKIPLSTKKVTRTPLSVQQAKHTVKANVFKNKMRCDCESEFVVDIILVIFIQI